MTACIYCGKDEVSPNSPPEHIVQSKVSGCACFVSHEVCGDCNSHYGKLVDAPFAKSFRVQAATIEAGLNNRGKTPYVFLGSPFE